MININRLNNGTKFKDLYLKACEKIKEFDIILNNTKNYKYTATLIKSLNYTIQDYNHITIYIQFLNYLIHDLNLYDRRNIKLIHL